MLLHWHSHSVWHSKGKMRALIFDLTFVRKIWPQIKVKRFTNFTIPRGSLNGSLLFFKELLKPLLHRCSFFLSRSLLLSFAFQYLFPPDYLLLLASYFLRVNANFFLKINYTDLQVIRDSTINYYYCYQPLK